MIVEVTTFRLLPDAHEPSFLASDHRVQTELVPHQPGFVRRTTARDQEEWLVVTLWATTHDAVAYVDAAGAHPAYREFEGFIDTASLNTHRYETLN